MLPSLMVESATPLVRSGPVSFALSSLIRYSEVDALEAALADFSKTDVLELPTIIAASGLNPSNAVVRPHRSWWTDRRRTILISLAPAIVPAGRRCRGL